MMIPRRLLIWALYDDDDDDDDDNNDDNDDDDVDVDDNDDAHVVANWGSVSAPRPISGQSIRECNCPSDARTVITRIFRL